MKIKKEPNEIFAEYENGRDYNQNRDLYDNVKKNRRFFAGDQWYGVNAPDMTKPVFNIIKRVVSYFVAMLVSDDIGVHISPFEDTPQNKAVADIMADEVERVMERTKITMKTRRNIQNSCTDGDTGMFINFDPDIETNQSYKGGVEAEIVENTHVIFGNPYCTEVQKQPYILVVQRLYTKQVKDMAEEWGVSEDEIENITSDLDNYQNDDRDNESELTTVITKFWKEKNKITETDQFGLPVEKTVTSVHSIKVTRQVVLKEETDMEYKLYPIAWFSWEKVENSYHGKSPITGLIPNQIFVNKIYAMCMVYMTNMGFPRVFYDENKIAKLTNDVTKATAITNMDMAGKVIDAVKAPDFSNQIIQLIDSTIQYTKETMGASDAALGEISNPNNTSAIVSVQQASSVPLEIQKLDFYQFMEDIVRILMDVMSCTYGVRTVKISESQAKDLNLIQGYQPDMFGNPQPVYMTYTQIDFSMLKNMNYDLDVEIGQSSYWSEQTQVQTADSLFDRQIISDPILYLECIPDKYIPNKRKIMETIKRQQEEMMMQQQMMQMQAAAVPPTEEGDPNVTRGMKDGVDNRGAANPQLQETYAKSKEFYQS